VPVTALLAGLAEDAVVVAASDIGNHDNIGGLYRNAAAFGAAAVLLDDRCGDPFYRKSIRVSVGAVLRMPAVQPMPVADLVEALLAAGFEVIALTPGAGETLASLRPGGRRALLLGSEGPGLPRAIIDRCRAVRIPMSGGFDSLNVAVTSAIALHQLTAFSE
jgi:tRNA G18 (ribose-2'-O)-methylase SpoU